MKTSKCKPALAVALCALAIAALAAAPAYISAARDKRILREGNAAQRPAREEGLCAEGVSNPVAKALYIDRAYATDSQIGYSASAGSLERFGALKAAGVIPEQCVLVGDFYYHTPNGSCVYVEPVSGVVISLAWTGEARDADASPYYPMYDCDNGVETETLLERYTAFLGLEGITDWVNIEHKGPYQTDTTVGRYSPSTQIYISTARRADGTSCGVSASSHAAEEMAPLLAVSAGEE